MAIGCWVQLTRFWVARTQLLVALALFLANLVCATKSAQTVTPIASGQSFIAMKPISMSVFWSLRIVFAPFRVILLPKVPRKFVFS